MIAYHGNPEIKAKYMSRVAAHREADELVQGTGWEDGKGCAVGCMFDGYDHHRGSQEINFPEELLHLCDAIHEGLSEGEALPDAPDKQAWVQRFMGAPRDGADLSLAWPRICLWMLSDETNGVRRFVGTEHGVPEAIDAVIALYREWCEAGRKPDKKRFKSAAWSARSAAESAAESAWSAAAWSAWSARSAWSAWSAAESAAAESAWSAAESAAAESAAAWSAWSAWSAAESAAAESAAWSAARSEFWTSLASKTCEVLASCPCPASEPATP